MIVPVHLSLDRSNTAVIFIFMTKESKNDTTKKCDVVMDYDNLKRPYSYMKLVL